MLGILVYIIIAVVAVMALQILHRPGYALAVCWSMLALESVLQQGNRFLLQRSSFVNIAVAALAGLAATWIILNGRLKSVRIPTNLILYAGLMALAGMSIIWSLDPAYSRIEINRALPYVITLCVIMPLCGHNETQLRHAVNATMFFGALVLVAVVLAERSRRGIYLTTIGGVEQQANPLANATYAGIVTICALFSIYRYRTNVFWLIPKILIAALGLFAIVKSGSRGQLIALVATCFVWLPITARVAAKRSTIIALVLGFVVVASSIMLIDESHWSSRWQWDRFVADRDGRIDMATGMLEAYWDKGGITLLTGLGNSSAYQIVGFYPHNVPVEVLTEEGLVGFALLMTIMVVPLLQCLRAMGSEKLSPDIRVDLGILAAIASFQAITSVKQGSLWGSAQLFAAFIILGWYLSWLKSRKDSPSGSNLSEPGIRVLSPHASMLQQ